jgi:hypothetical protein
MSEISAYQTPSLRLPLRAGEQAQKHVTLNEALTALDALVQLAVASRALSAPPATPAEGERFIVGQAPSGAWSGHADELAVWRDGNWLFHMPRQGWLAWAADEGVLLVFDGAGWTASAEALQHLMLLGIGTAADAENPFAAKLNKALWTAKTAAEGGSGDLRYTMNKESAADVLSLLFQSGFSGRAEIGLVGNDNFSIKVSADGADWLNAIVVNANDGSIGLGVQPESALHIRRSGANLARLIVEGESAVNNQVRRVSPNANQANFVMMKARGAIGAETAVSQNDMIGSLQGQAYDGAAYRAVFFLTASVIAPTPSATNMEARAVITLAPPGSVAAAEIFRLEHATGLSLFGANPVIDQNRHHRLRPYTVATLPAANPAGQLVYVSDGAANKRLAVSDGSSWRFPDGSVVS